MPTLSVCSFNHFLNHLLDEERSTATFGGDNLQSRGFFFVILASKCNVNKRLGFKMVFHNEGEADVNRVNEAILWPNESGHKVSQAQHGLVIFWP